MQPRMVFFLILLSFRLFGQHGKETIAADVNYFTGNVMAHSPDLHHFLAGHPEGFMAGVVRQTYGDQEWHQEYNFPDYGIYVLYQDFKNPILGRNYAVGLQYNFYFWKRRLQFKVSQGIAMTTNPYDQHTNYRNSAFGSRFMENTNFALNFRQKIFGNFDLQAGLMFTHFSNGRIKSPNSGVNTYNINLGVNYNLSPVQDYIVDTLPKQKITEPVKYNLVLRTGANESLIAQSGQYIFYHPGVYLDKRISRKFSIQAGAEVFLSNFQKRYIAYKAAAYPEDGISRNTDWKRGGIFIGAEMFISRLSFEAQLGYYVYRPLKTDVHLYDRVGAKYYLTDKIFTGISVKTHGFLAEAMEFNLGVRL